MINKCFIISLWFSCLIYSSIFGQVNFQSDSSITESIYKLRLNSFDIEPLFALKMPLLNNNYSKYFFYKFKNLDQSPKFNLLENFRIQKEMTQSLKIYRQGFNKNNLGMLGEILGYTNAAATIGLAIYHISKYPKKYGLK